MTEHAMRLAGAGNAAPARGTAARLRRWWRQSPLGPVAAIVALVIVVWYAAALPMNSVLTGPLLDHPGVTLAEEFETSWSLERPVLPAPHQVLAELKRSIWDTPLVRETADSRAFNPRNLLYHVWVTLSATLAGFAIGAVVGLLLAVAVVHLRTLDLSLMPWIIASQAVPVLAIAPIVIIALGSAGVTGLLPKALISAYLSFFPVTIGMVKGLRSPERAQLELLHTYSASRAQVLWLLRLPAAVPMLFASLKVAVAVSLVGAIVAELPTGASAGLGARLLAGSYYGQTIQIWAALFAAGATAALLVGAVDLAGRAAGRFAAPGERR